MNPRFALAAVLVTSAALAACGWLLPDGELEVTATDAGTQVEDAVSRETGSPALDSGATAEDANVGPITDAGDPKWGEPVLLRESTSDAGALSVRRGLPADAGDFYFSDGNQLFYAASMDSAARPLTYNDGGTTFIGYFPSPTLTSVGPGIVYSNVAGILFAVAHDKTDFTTPVSVTAGTTPYAVRNGSSYYFTDLSSIYRGVSGTSPTVTKVVFVGREGAPNLNFQRYPVVNTNETIIYFAEGPGGTGSIWAAKRRIESNSVTYIDAHPVFPMWSNTINLPTEVSEDGKELIFTRVIPNVGSASYLVKQL